MKKNLNFTLLFCSLMIFYFSIEKSSAQWISTGPDGGTITLMTSSGTALYSIAGYVGHEALYTSVDNGNTWTVIVSSTIPNANNQQKKALAKIGNSLYLGTSVGLYCSDDNGLTWVNKYAGTAYCFAANSTTLFAGTNRGILRSSDNGNTWTKVIVGASSRYYIASILATDTIIYSGDGYGGGVRQSTDDGLTWGTCSNGADLVRAVSLALIGTDVYAGTWSSGVWKYTNGTGLWTLTNPFTATYAYNGSIVGDASVLFATSFTGVIQSTDGGANWMDVTGNGIDVAISPNGGQAIMTTNGVYVGTNGGIYRTQNNGDTWIKSDVGIKAQCITMPALASSGSGIFTATGTGKVFRSPDQGQSWTNVSAGLIPNTNPNPYPAMIGANPTTIFYDVSMSTNGGTSWSATNAPGRVGNYTVGMYSGNMPWLEQNGVYVTCDLYNGVFRSTDNGVTWASSNTGMDGGEYGFWSLYSDGSTLYIGTTSGGYYSSDNGISWIKSVTDVYMPNWGPANFLSTGTCMLYGVHDNGQRGIFRSTDHGANWTTVLANATSDGMVIAGASIYIAGRTTVNGIDYNTVYRSDDDGLTWTDITSGLDAVNMNNASLAASGSKVFISIVTYNDSYMFSSDNKGASWHNVTDNLYPKTGTTSFVVLNNKVYAGTTGSSLWQRNLDEFTAPSQPSTINGYATPCIGSSQTYSVTNIYGITYTWQFPSGWVVTAGGTTSSVTVTVGSATGIVMVTPSNVFGFGPSQFLIVSQTIAGPGQPSTITGTVNPLEGTIQNYSVVNVAGVSYAWTFPAGWIQTGGDTTNSVTVTVGSGSGDIVVTPSTICGNGTPQTLNVVTGPANVTIKNVTLSNGQVQCYNATNTIIVAEGDSAFLVKSGGQATFIAGQMIKFMPGTKVDSGGYLLGTITTTGQYCGQMAAPIVAVKMVEEETPVISSQPLFSLYPNPTTGTFTLDIKGESESGSAKVEIFSMRGDRVLTSELYGNGKHELSLSGNPVGIYVIRVISDSKMETARIIKQ
ncbi:MAG: T9SS type A sorting domain-containing protein [Bacteroidales bacterium]|jgi:photosystem II stability/assembly factor-like uncharacterized protein|nr:T9SS type A sorting domain-containing protein [Bacteroidales bacterium]